jgi:hypothetical protein
MREKDYITQLSKEDMKELAALTNIESGFLVRIDKTGGKIKIGIDESALALAINGFFRNGGCNTNAANCTAVPFNPPS